MLIMLLAGTGSLNAAPLKIFLFSRAELSGGPVILIDIADIDGDEEVRRKIGNLPVDGKLYRDGYGGAGSVEIPGFVDYVGSVRRRVEAAAGGAHLGRLEIDRGLYLGLTRIAQKEDIGCRIDL